MITFLELIIPMSSIEQLETLRNSELYDDCKTLVIMIRFLKKIFFYFFRQNLF